MMSVYSCDACPLAFQVGGYGFWDRSGHVEQVVCYRCGTMHRLIEDQKVCRVFALAGPVFNVDNIYEAEPEWRCVGDADGVGGWRKLTCSVCKQVGQLRSKERLPRHSEWPEEPLCPLCRKPVQYGSCTVIN